MGLYKMKWSGRELGSGETERERECVCERERGRASEKDKSSVGTKINRFTQT